MIDRCTNEHNRGWDYYGGRGIRVCARWLDFGLFYADIGPRPSPGHSIDRIDSDGNYEPSNCRWATAKEQSRNTRKQRIVEWLGRKMSVAEFAELMGVPPLRVFARINNGWEIEEVAVWIKTGSVPPAVLGRRKKAGRPRLS